MPVIVACRSCGRKLRVTDDLLRSKVQCPSCGESFMAEGSALDSPAEIDHRPEDEEDDDRPWERPAAPTVRRDCEPERGAVVLTMGILSLFLPVVGIFLGLAAWIMGAKDLGKMRRRQMDPQGQGTTQAGLICGIVGMVLNMLMTLCCVLPMMLNILIGVTAARSMPPPRTVRFTRPAPAPPGPEDAP